MIYTTYFSAIKKLPEGVEPVSIARFLPKSIKIRSCSKFFPPEELIKGYKSGKLSADDYASRYNAEVLAGLNAKAAAKALDGKALVCYEKTGDFCHRNLVAEWFRKNGVQCEEYVEKKPADRQLSLFDALPARKFPLRYKEINGDIFSAPERYAFAYCVSADKEISDGVALEFCNRFPNMLKKFERTKFEVGKCYGFTEPTPRRSIINVVTKEKRTDKTTYDNFNKALEDLKRVVVAHRIKFLAIPMAGCDLDVLNWERVSYILTGVFHDVDVAVVIYKISK